MKRTKTAQSRKGKPYTSKGKQARIVGAHLAGKSKTEIAKETGVSRNTIRRILSQSEVQTLLDSYRDSYRDMVPGAIKILSREMGILPRKGRHATSDQIKAAIEITKGAQVAVPRSQGELEVRTDRFATMSDQELKDFIVTETAKLKLGNA